MKNTLYQVFHQSTAPQKRMISKNNFTYRIILSVIDKYLKKGSKVLDIGCGAGTLSLYIAGQGCKVIGIDIAENAILAAKKSAELMDIKNVQFFTMDFSKKTPSGKDKFDIILCIEVLEHLKEERLALERLFDLLSPGGIAIISVPSKNAPLYRLGLATDFDKRVGHLRRYTSKELEGKCVSIGLTILESNKTEGVVRNFLFLNPVAGKLVRFVKYFMVTVVSFVDELSLRLFGESQLFVIVKKQ